MVPDPHFVVLLCKIVLMTEMPLRLVAELWLVTGDM
jgi:hypothetical protein